MLISELIESVSSNLLYHSVYDFSIAEKILQSGKIEPRVSDHGEGMGRRYPVISLSRSQFYRFPNYVGDLQFVIDRDALKRAGIKVKPFGWGDYVKQRWPAKEVTAEEEVLSSIPVKSPFIVGIQINPKITPQEIPRRIIDLADKRGIPIQFMKRYKGEPSAKSTGVFRRPF